MAEVGAIYFALIDPTVPIRKKAWAMLRPIRPIGYGVAGAITGLALPGGVVAGAGIGGALGEFVNVYEHVVEPRHVQQALNFFKADSGFGAQSDYMVTAQLGDRAEPGAIEAMTNRNNSKSRSRRNGPQDEAARYRNVLAHLRALQWAYWVAHWQAKGSNSYGDHLLLERLYKGFDKPIDRLGERLVAYYGNGSVNHVLVGTEALVILQAYNQHLETDPFGTLRKLETGLKNATHNAWSTANESYQLGLDDFFMGLAESQDERIYLLGQRAKTNGRARANTGRRAKSFTVSRVKVTLGARTSEGYPVMVELPTGEGMEWFLVGFIPRRDPKAAKEMVRASQITEIRANGRRRR